MGGNWGDPSLSLSCEALRRCHVVQQMGYSRRQTSPPDGPGSHIVEALNETVKFIPVVTKRPILAKRITFHLVSSHSGVECDETADQLAKEAAVGSVSPAYLLQSLLSKPLVHVSSVIRTPIIVLWLFCQCRCALGLHWRGFAWIDVDSRVLEFLGRDRSAREEWS